MFWAAMCPSSGELYDIFVNCNWSMAPVWLSKGFASFFESSSYRWSILLRNCCGRFCCWFAAMRI
jgi:hypothetical protein